MYTCNLHNILYQLYFNKLCIIKKQKRRETQTDTERGESFEDTDTQREDSPGPMQAETGVMYLHTTKECQRLLAAPEAERKAWNRFSPRGFRESTALPIS